MSVPLVILVLPAASVPPYIGYLENLSDNEPIDLTKDFRVHGSDTAACSTLKVLDLTKYHLWYTPAREGEQRLGRWYPLASGDVFILKVCTQISQDKYSYVSIDSGATEEEYDQIKAEVEAALTKTVEVIHEKLEDLR